MYLLFNLFFNDVHIPVVFAHLLTAVQHSAVYEHDAHCQTLFHL
jgi:hypothetical protein